VVARLRARLPHEDIVVLADDAYAPYARLQPRVVVDRVARLSAELVAGHAAKVLVLASAAGSEDALPALRSALPATPVIGVEATAAYAAAHSRGGVVAVVVGDGCVRGLLHARGLRRQRAGAGGVAVAAWPGLRELVDRGRPAEFDPQPRIAELHAAGVDTLVLACPHAWSVSAHVATAAAPAGIAVVDYAEILAARVHAALARGRAIARRRRAGRLTTISSDPVRGAPAHPIGG
jgi:glutamate racemase